MEPVGGDPRDGGGPKVAVQGKKHLQWPASGRYSIG